MLKLTLYIGHADETARPVAIAQMADKAGLYGVAIGEHVSLGADLTNYPYAGGLSHGDAGRKPYLEPLVWQGAVAASTKQIRISNCILLGPLRPAVLLAKQLTSVDVISGGRLEPCFGCCQSNANLSPQDTLMPLVAAVSWRATATRPTRPRVVSCMFLDR